MYNGHGTTHRAFQVTLDSSIFIDALPSAADPALALKILLAPAGLAFGNVSGIQDAGTLLVYGGTNGVELSFGEVLLGVG